MIREKISNAILARWIEGILPYIHCMWVCCVCAISIVDKCVCVCARKFSLRSKQQQKNARNVVFQFHFLEGKNRGIDIQRKASAKWSVSVAHMFTVSAQFRFQGNRCTSHWNLFLRAVPRLNYSHRNWMRLVQWPPYALELVANITFNVINFRYTMHVRAAYTNAPLNSIRTVSSSSLPFNQHD